MYCTSPSDTVNRFCTKETSDVRASGGRLLDPDQTPKRLGLISNCVNCIVQAPHTKELEEYLLQCQRKDAEVNERTADLYSKQGHTDITELAVIDETTQWETFKRHKAKGKPFCTCGIFLEVFSPEKTSL